jgi:hypothetical protein
MEGNRTTPEEQMKKLVVRISSRRLMFFYAALIASQVVLFFLIPNQGRDASWVWVAFKWVLLVASIALFARACRQYQVSK